MRKPTKESFGLTKIKLRKDGGADVSYVDPSGDYTDTITIESDRVPHPDFRQSLDRLRKYVVDVFAFRTVYDVVLDSEFGATAKQKSTAQNAVEELATRLNVTGLSISGSDEGLIIMSTFHIRVANTKAALNSPRIILSKTQYGFEDSLNGDLWAIREEAYEYLFEGKSAQLSIF